MLVVLHANQLEHIIEKAIIDRLRIRPEGLHVDSRYLMKNQDNWEVSAQFDSLGIKRRLRLNINPETGQVLTISENAGDGVTERS